MVLPENYTVIRRDVKHARLRVHEDGRVQLFVPLYFTNEEVAKLIEMKSRWIASKQQFFKQKERIMLRRNELLLLGNRYAYYFSTQYTNKVVVNHESKTIQARRNLLDIAIQEKWLKSIAGKYIRQRVAELSDALLLPYNKLFIRSQKRKWGNCSAEKNISINWRIIKAPPFVIDYVITHELCHTVIMKHTVKFETLLNSHCPNYRQAQAWLGKYGNSLNEAIKYTNTQTLTQSNDQTVKQSNNQTITLSGSTSESITLSITDLLYIESVGNYVKVYHLCNNEVCDDMLRATSKQMEETLKDYPTVVRCHRAFLVNLAQVEKISSQSGTMQLVMQHTQDILPVSRTNTAKVKSAFNNL